MIIMNNEDLPFSYFIYSNILIIKLVKLLPIITLNKVTSLLIRFIF